VWKSSTAAAIRLPMNPATKGACGPEHVSIDQGDRHCHAEHDRGSVNAP
jgi:hypothetical protein